MDDEQFLMDMIASGSNAGVHGDNTGDAAVSTYTSICPVATKLINPEMPRMTKKQMYIS